MQKVGYQGVVDKVNAFYTKFLAQPWQTMFKVFNQGCDPVSSFTKLIIADLMKKFPSIPQRIEEDYHSVKDDILLEYETVFVGVEIPMIQPQPVVSTQGTHRTTPSTHRSPTLPAASPRKKKRKQVAEETSSPRKLLKVTIRQQKQRTPPIPPPSDDRERDEIAEATLLSLALLKIAISAEA
ncbi:hypothetical protein Tco_0051755 [Tanacetum coccineum]